MYTENFVMCYMLSEEEVRLTGITLFDAHDILVI